jgi:fumarate reductase flavoprotein subunit
MMMEMEAGMSTTTTARGEAPWHEREWDLVIMGAGTTGLAAAAFAGLRNGRVLVIEASAELGGSLLVAHGQISAAGTRLQRQKGIHDTPEMHFEEALRISKGTIDHDLARLAIFNAAEIFDWLCDNGYDVLPECPSLSNAHEPYDVARYYWGKDWGRSLARVLVAKTQEQVARGTVTLQLETRIVGLQQDAAGAVTGVETEEAGGVRRRVRARNVLLAAGGYAANPEMFERLVGVPLYARAAYRFNQGVGIELGVGAGGYVRGRDKYLSNFGWLLQDDQFPSPIIGRVNTYPNERPPFEIYVNMNAKRFIREDEPSVDLREHTLLRQPNLRYWVIFDQAIFERAPPIVYGWTREQMAAAFNTQFPFTRADTLEDLARAIGIDPAGLAATVAAYNAGRESGRDFFGREHMPAPISQGPFHAIRQQGASVTSTVGLAVDEQLRVIRKDRSPIPGLYAAGEILGSGQLQGDAFVGGMMAMPCMVFGRLLGEKMIPF